MDPEARDVAWFRGVGAVLSVLLMAQAVLAGQFLTSRTGAIAPHRVIGEGLGAVALLLLVVAYRLRTVDRFRWWLAAALFVLIIAQTGLGFAGRDSATAAALHIPLGVLTFGVALVATMPRSPG